MIRFFSRTPRQTALLVLVPVCLTGCGASAPKATQNAQTNTTPWFCQTGEAEAEWECVQDETLAEKPVPTRSPPLPERTRNPAPLPAVQPPAPSLAAPLDPTPVPPPVPAPEPAREIEQPSPPAPVTQAQMPLHQRLAYRPEKPISLMEVPETFWAVQLVAVSSKEALERFARENNLQGMSAARIAVQDKLYYILLLGIYETRANAERAITDLPDMFQESWIRSVGSLQRAIAAGDELTGTKAP